MPARDRRLLVALVVPMCLSPVAIVTFAVVYLGGPSGALASPLVWAMLGLSILAVCAGVLGYRKALRSATSVSELGSSPSGLRRAAILGIGWGFVLVPVAILWRLLDLMRR